MNSPMPTTNKYNPVVDFRRALDMAEKRFGMSNNK